MKNVITILLIMMLILISIPSFATEEEMITGDEKILIIFSNNILLPATTVFYNGINQNLMAAGMNATSIHIESYNKQNIDSIEQQENFIQYLRVKYNLSSFDAIVAVGDVSMQIINKYHDDVFKDLPVVFVPLGLYPFEKVNYVGSGFFVESAYDIEGTLSQALKLFKDTKEVIVARGALGTEHKYDQTIENYILAHKSDIQITYADHSSKENFFKAIEDAPADAIILYLSFFQDDQGISYVPRNIMEEMYERSNRPIFSCVGSFFGYGTIGGSMLSFEYEGHRTGDVVQRILKGDYSKGFIEKVPPAFVSMYDWRIMEEFGVEKAVSEIENVILINEKVTIFDTNPEYVYGTAILMFLLLSIAVLMSLLYLRKRRYHETLMGMNEQLGDMNASLEEEIQEKNEAIERNEYVLNHDDLTNLMNRRMFSTQINQLLDAKSAGGLFYIDLDNFKHMNDTIGHDYGDQVLIDYAHIFKKIYGDHVYRVGGDEFIVILPNKLDQVLLESEAKKALVAIENYNRDSDVNFFSTLSIGICVFPKDGETEKELMIALDVAMYESKIKGRNQYNFYRNALIEAFEKRVASEHEVRKIVEDLSFQLYYQPIVDTQTGQLAYFEALIRGKNVAFSPFEFIQTAERIGLIHNVTNWVIRQAFRQLKIWKDKGLKLYKISINISPKDLLNASLMIELNDAISQCEFAGQYIEIEVTENFLMYNKEHAISMLSKLRAMGLKIALDDFGTGYSSLNYLTFLPIDKIKLDKSIKDRWIRDGKVTLINNVINIAKDLKLEVVTEGVENKEEWDILVKTDCDYIQGYYFGKPMFVEEIEEKYLYY